MKARRARTTDARRLAELCGQLGYPTSRKQMTLRLRRVLGDRDAICLVAVDSTAGIVGWIHASVTPLMEVDRRAEVNGLVVDEKCRSRGAGATLLGVVEKWARRRGCLNISLRSNIIRERAHQFYLRQGYEHYKTQKAFRKAL